MTRGRSSSRLQRGWWQIAAGAALGALASNRAKKVQERQEALQREFAQMGIRWRVADAKAAGIHPLYALGGAGATYSPSGMVGGGDALSGALEGLGQYLGRAEAQPKDHEDRLGQFAQQAAQLSDQRVMARMLAEEQIAGARQQNIGTQLDNEAKRLLLLKTLRELGPPGPSVHGSGDVKLKPSEQIASQPGMPSQEAYRGEGKPAMVPYRLGGPRTGFSMDVPSSEFGEGLEGGGPMAWILGALGIGGHYGGKVVDYLTDTYGGRELQARIYRYLQNQGVYPRRKGM